MKSSFLVCLLTIAIVFNGNAQQQVKRKEFFLNDSIIEIVLNTNFTKLIVDKKGMEFQPAKITWNAGDSTHAIVEQIKVRMRGYYRRDFCSFASMLFDFADSTEKSALRNLKKIKIVVPCEWGPDDEQLLLKEFLLYRIYQLFSDKSFRVRLLHFKFEDNSGYTKSYKQYGFAIEPIDDLAKRNNMQEEETRKVLSEQTNLLHTTMVSIFQYMIGNTDWAIPPQHNMKLIIPKDSALAPPYIVPYDFDFSGAVNAIYAEPLPTMGIKKVTDRKYLGFKRTLPEVKAILEKFTANEAAIYKLIEDFKLLSKFSKNEMTLFFQGFFKEIQDDANIKKIFVDGARAK